jgi:hypothetical protein
MTDDRDLDALLRQPTERLAPPDGSWELISRRARRRKWVKASVGVAAGVVVVAGAVPAVIAVRDTSNNQTLAVKSPTIAAHRSSATPAPVPVLSAPASPSAPQPSSLAGFTPTSVSFVSQTAGWLWGSTSHFGPGIVAHTGDGGRDWSALPAPAIGSTDPAGDGDYGIRFADGATGYVFGSALFVTQDAGQDWRPVDLPGRVIDLETMNNRVWALVSTCTGCDSLHLYGATVDDPTHFAPVPGVPVLRGSADAIDGMQGEIAVHNTSVFVMTGGASLWSSADGVSWQPQANPCPPGDDFADALSAWSSSGLVAVCGGEPSAGQEQKLAFESSDSGADWTAVPAPPPNGYAAALSAGTARDVVLGTTHEAGGFVTINGGRSWALANTGAINLSFVGFISATRAVALPDPNDETAAFLTSDDAGRSWTVMRFR